MSNFNESDHPRGAGGRFTETARSEGSVALAPRPIVLDCGTGDDFTEYADGEVVERIHVRHSEDGGYWVSAEKTVDFLDLITPEKVGADDEDGVADYLDRHSRPIRDFMRERYGAELGEDDWDAMRLEINTSLPEGPLTADAIANSAWSPGIVNLHNESDPGSFGSENLDRLLLQHLAAQATVEDQHRAMGEAARWTDRDVDYLVETRLGERELPDSAALAIARGFAGPDYPALAKLGQAGYADKQELNTELSRLYAEHKGTRRLSQRIDMMFTWVLHGGNNDLTQERKL